MGDALFDKQRYAAAGDVYRSVLRNRPGYTPCRLNFAASLLRLGLWDQSKEEYLKTTDTAIGLLNVGLLAMYEGDKATAERSIDEAIRREPDNPAHHHDRAACHLFFEEWEQGWAEYEWRWLGDQASWRPDPVYEWKGNQSIPSVLLLTEQGFGDCIHFARYIPFAQPRKIMICRPEWKPILGAMPGVDECPDKGEACAFTSLMSLPYRTRQFEPYWPGPYLHATAPVRFPSDKLNVGICWRGNRSHKHDSWRSATVNDFAPLATIPGINLVSLQVPSEPVPFAAQTPKLSSYIDTINVIAGLDLVVTVDTSVLHLAGAMGRPVYGLLAKIPNWRWGLSRTDSPWYPSLRLFRQSRLTDWSGPIHQVFQAIKGIRK